jgi:ADP-heptose:LPS heptosyltransferase
MQQKKKNILVIRYTPIKLFFQTLPAFAALREHHANDNLVLLTDETLFEFAKTIQHNGKPLFDKVWLDIKPHWLEIPALIDIIKRLKKGKFARVYDLSFTEQATWYFRLLGFKKPEWNGGIKWCKFPYNPKLINPIHYQDYISNQIAVAGVKQHGNYQSGHYNFKNLSKVDISGLELPKYYAMFCPAGDKEKIAHKWNIFNYVSIIESLEKQGIKTVLVGDNNNDYWLNNNICKQCIDATPINLSGKTNIAELSGVAANALFCVGNDTAPTHIAALNGIKTIMLLSRLSPAEMIVPKVSNLAVIEEPYLENLSVERVVEAITEFCEIKKIITRIRNESNGIVVDQPPEETTIYKSF